ncbi:sugar ABC transporter permease [Paenibacillus anaericanus]|uniref:Sugar ABC transporter permease n=1 Tax=Paenibacillus anaericanus TaxID=170367 RepID=A0A3S1DQE3_9BACL|nr:sugar ABC transporter permease [Paenibacillus anaericanus]RUT46677.1 sugar ABC transporter permease [Paenibacillus anaericanus]
MEFSDRLKKLNSKKNKYSWSETRDAWLFTGIGVVLFLVFVLYPQVKNFYMAFTEYNILPGQPSRFIGLENFRTMFISDGALGESKYFWVAFKNSLWAVIITVPGQLILGVMLATLIHNLTRGRLLYKILLYIPVISSWIVVSVLFKYIFQDTKGALVNYALIQANLIDTPIAWLQNATTANIVIWALCIWKGVGWVMIIYTAALQSVPKSMYEVAKIEGANAIQTFFKITIPLLKETTIYSIVQLTIGAFGIMIQVIMITGGGPMGKTETLNSYMYSQAFSQFKFGYASAVSIVMGIVVIGITLIQRRAFKEGQ